MFRRGQGRFQFIQFILDWPPVYTRMHQSDKLYAVFACKHNPNPIWNENGIVQTGSQCRRDEINPLL